MPQIAPTGRTTHASNLTMQAPHAAQRPTLNVPTVTASQDVKDATPRRLLGHKKVGRALRCERCSVAEPTALIAYFRRACQDCGEAHAHPTGQQMTLRRLSNMVFGCAGRHMV